MTFSAVGFGFLLWPYSQTLGLDVDSHPIVFALIYLPAFTLAFYSSVRRLKPWPDQLQAVGIPLGISCSIFVLVAGSQNINSSAELFEAIGNAFLALFHGGVIAAFGYFFASKEDFQSAAHSRADIVILVSLCCAPTFLSLWLLDLGLLHYLHPETALLSFAPYVFLAGARGAEPFRFLWGGKDPRDFPSGELIKATVVGMLGPVFLSMIVWMWAAVDPSNTVSGGISGQALQLGVLGILYGASNLTIIICLSKPSKNLSKAAWRASWHALEIYALLILVVYAPPSLLELISFP